MRTDRIEFLGIEFDTFDTREVLERVREVTGRSPYGYFVTPNVDHVVRLHDPAGKTLWELYQRAEYCTCDSRVLRTLARLKGLSLPLVAGSDLTALIFDRTLRPGDRVAIVGGDAALLDQLRELYASITFLQHIPPMGLRNNPPAIDEAASFIARAGARFTFIAVGSPQQELIAARALERGDCAGLALCIGASIDFLVGRRARAPKVLQLMGLEWAHRLASNPAQMWRRYLLDGPKIFRLAYSWRPGATGRR